ncbi:MAG: GspMb/PilO family protein [Vicinamibacterales bacterium]
MTLLTRILIEKRPLVVGLGLAMALNAAMYGFVVRPLGVRSTGAARRADAAMVALRAAERDLAGANALVEGKAHADQDLSTFYAKVIPANLPGARGLTRILPALAQRANVAYLGSTTKIDTALKGQRFGHLQITMAMQGEWEGIRRFIYELEASPSFVIIDDMTLAQTDPAEPLTLTLELSTYYRLGANGG